MGQLIIPNEIKIHGPWILEESELDELGNVIEIIESKMQEALDFAVEKGVKERFDELKSYDKDISIDKVKQKIIERYPFNENESKAVLISKDKKKIVDDSLIALLKDKNLSEFRPSELFVKITKGPIEFQLEITSKYDGELETRLKINEDNLASDINYELNKWIRKHRPNLALQKWSSWFPFVLIPILSLLILISMFFIQLDTDAYKTELHNQANQILIDGFSNDETKKAVEIILKLETGFLPQDYKAKPEKNSMIVNIWIFILLVTVILLIKPKTIIGLGKNKWKVWFFKKWIYCVFIFIPCSILIPILRSKLF